MNCEEKIFPPRDICPYCGQNAQKKIEMSGKGTVYSYTTIYEAPTGFEKFAPYVEALVKLDEGPMVLAQLTDLDVKKSKRTAKVDQGRGWPEIYDEIETTDFVVEIGMPVEMVTRRLTEDGDNGLITYGYKFRPLLSSAKEASTSSR